MSTHRGTHVAAGGVLGGLTGVTLTLLTQRQRMTVAGRGLATAAGAYVLARRFQGTSRPELKREVGALAAASSLAMLAARMPDFPARATLAAGWVAHAGFDLTHRRGDDSLVPDWYPPLCVGFDVALAATLLASDRTT